ncbi:acetyl esterase/lipase [Actinoplanes lutulentus]|uniref:Acetyl esterase/lipase n=1 Tax=Actinoplanes lutulentus TaxID=1287878 RepID=A0A327YX51_9ACTN|nr:alpha/beta fold hydrolase [Actinoplanes lutulentus]MBB2943484.1 acetyl esterase/lipase [Actinoplanes lutulentus]RAK25997.1 acetyl esterase/lipase [Actinoplanes lutulentus]
MVSWQMNGVAHVMRLVYRRKFVTEAAGRRTLDKPKGPSTPPKRLAATSSTINGFTVYKIGENPDKAVIYLHGGAYTSEIVGQHWSLIRHIAEQTGCEVHVPIYGLSPKHHGLEALALVTELIKKIGKPVYLAGDSAGGGLALLAAQQRTGTVSGLTLIAPWLDLTMSNPGIDEIEPTDPWLYRAGLRPIADAWTGGLELDDPRLSPIHGDLDGLPPLQVLVGTRDITLPDCRLLRDRLPAATKVTYHEQEGAIHVYPLLPVPEAKAGRAAIVEHITANCQGSSDGR